MAREKIMRRVLDPASCARRDRDDRVFFASSRFHLNKHKIRTSFRNQIDFAAGGTIPTREHSIPFRDEKYRSIPLSRAASEFRRALSGLRLPRGHASFLMASAAA